ncbi:MAG: Rrf2 family transcriptional regulator [Verrucomicrobia bacterium]|nr:Rrf2 family transcriptional regulator [Verrucomicrobiota bacterium]
MRITKRAEYALRALLFLAQSPPGRLVPIGEIAERENIPADFLEQILLALRRADLLSSRRGIGGGYKLSRAADAIHIGEAMRALEEPLAPVPCTAERSREKCTCPDPRTCPLRAAMQEVADQAALLLDRMTLADAVARSRPEARVSFDI